MITKSSRPFSEELIKAFKRLLNAAGSYSADNLNIKVAIENYPELLKKREIKTAGILVVTSNKGLATIVNNI